MLYDETGIVAFPYRIECSNNLSEVEIATMYFKIQIDWNKYIVLHMNKNTAESIQEIFGNPDYVWKLEYDRTLGQGLIKSQDWKPTVTLMRADEFRDLIAIGERIESFREDETTKEAA